MIDWNNLEKVKVKDLIKELQKRKVGEYVPKRYIEKDTK